MEEMFKRYPVRTFLMLAFSISWLIWALSPLLSMGDPQVQTMLDIIGLFTKAFFALIIMLRQADIPLMPPLRRHFSLFGIFTAILLFVMSTGFIEIRVITVFLALLMADFLAYMAGMLFAHRHNTDFFGGALSLLKTPWVILPVLVFPIMFAISNLLSYLYGGHIFWPFYMGEVAIYQVFYVLLFIFFIFFGSALIIEPAYRGFLAPYLIKKMSPLFTGLVLGVLMTVWLAPLFINGFFGEAGLGLEQLQATFNVLLWVVPLNVVLMWFYLRFKGVLWFAYLAHGSFFASLILLPMSTERGIYVPVMLWGLALLLSIFDRRMANAQQARFYLYK